MDINVQNRIQTFYSANQAAVDDLAGAIGVPGIWFCCLFDNESLCNPGATNSSSGAVGLNQMLPSTLAQYSVSPADYINGGVAYQCQVMKKFFGPVAGIIKRAGDLYLYDFWPAAIISNYAADFAIGVKNGTGSLDGISQAAIYSGNTSLDYDGDGIIDRQDFWSGFEAKYDTLLDASTPTGGYSLHDIWIDFKTNWFTWAVVAMVVLIVLYFIYKNFK